MPSDNAWPAWRIPQPHEPSLLVSDNVAMKWFTALTNNNSDSFAITVVEPTRPAAIWLTANLNEPSTHVPDGLAPTSIFNTFGNDESGGPTAAR